MKSHVKTFNYLIFKLLERDEYSDVVDFPFLGLDKAEKSPYEGWGVSGPCISPENEYV